jgi:hypothetical protein
MEAHELRLGGVDSQAVLVKPLRDNFQDALSITLVAEPDYEVVRVADCRSSLDESWFSSMYWSLHSASVFCARWNENRVKFRPQQSAATC